MIEAHWSDCRWIRTKRKDCLHKNQKIFKAPNSKWKLNQTQVPTASISIPLTSMFSCSILLVKQTPNYPHNLNHACKDNGFLKISCTFFLIRGGKKTNIDSFRRVKWKCMNIFIMKYKMRSNAQKIIQTILYRNRTRNIIKNWNQF